MGLMHSQSIPGVAAIVLYGSRLSAITATADSEPDFYVVVDSVRLTLGFQF